MNVSKKSIIANELFQNWLATPDGQAVAANAVKKYDVDIMRASTTESSPPSPPRQDNAAPSVIAAAASETTFLTQDQKGLFDSQGIFAASRDEGCTLDDLVNNAENGNVCVPPSLVLPTPVRPADAPAVLSKTTGCNKRRQGHEDTDAQGHFAASEDGGGILDALLHAEVGKLPNPPSSLLQTPARHAKASSLLSTTTGGTKRRRSKANRSIIGGSAKKPRMHSPVRKRPSISVMPEMEFLGSLNEEAMLVDGDAVERWQQEFLQQTESQIAFRISNLRRLHETYERSSNAIPVLHTDLAQTREMMAMLKKREATIRTAVLKHSTVASRAKSQAAVLNDELVSLKRQLENATTPLPAAAGPYSAISFDLLRFCAASKPLWQVSQLSPAYEHTRKSILGIYHNLVENGANTNQDLVSRLEESPVLERDGWARRLQLLRDDPKFYEKLYTGKGKSKNLQLAYRLAYVLDLDIDVEPTHECWDHWRDPFDFGDKKHAAECESESESEFEPEPES